MGTLKKIGGRIEFDHVGQAFVRGTRTTVTHVLWFMSKGISVRTVMKAFKIEYEDVLACLHHAAEWMGSPNQEHFPDAIVEDIHWSDPPTDAERRAALRLHVEGLHGGHRVV